MSAIVGTSVRDFGVNSEETFPNFGFATGIRFSIVRTQKMPFPSFEALSAAGTTAKANLETGRLYWIIQSPISEAVFVLNDVDNPAGPRQPAFQQAESSDGSPTLHPLSQVSLYEPPVSSVTVGIYELQDWADSWEEFHIYSDDDDCDGPCRCCGRLPPPLDRTITVTAAEKDSFLTIGDYVAAVQPWLLSLRQDLLWVKSTDSDVPLPEGTKLMVDIWTPEDLLIEDASNWLSAQVRRAKERLDQNQPQNPEQIYNILR